MANGWQGEKGDYEMLAIRTTKPNETSGNYGHVMFKPHEKKAAKGKNEPFGAFALTCLKSTHKASTVVTGW